DVQAADRDLPERQQHEEDDDRRRVVGQRASQCSALHARHDNSGPCARLRRMRWLIVLPFERPGHMGVDFAQELTALGHEVRTFAYRRDHVLYKNTASKTLYQRWIGRRLERLGLAWRPALTLVIKGGPFGPEFIARFRQRVGTRVVNVFPDNPLWMIPF